MKINTINSISRAAIPAKNNCRNLNRFLADSFICKTSNANFRGNVCKFQQWASNNGFNPQDVEQIISNEENKIGEGFTHCVYSIPNCDEYVLRTSKYSFPGSDYKNAHIKAFGDDSLNVNVGQQVASIEVPCGMFFSNSIEVLRKQKGEPLGIPPFQALQDPVTFEMPVGEPGYEARERKEHYSSTIHKLANLPESSYEKLIDDLEEASKHGYHFDHLNSNNLLIDEENSSINLIDMGRSNRKVDWGNVLYSLTNVVYRPTFVSQTDGVPMSKEEIAQTRTDSVKIIEKFTKAMQNKGVKFPPEGEYSVEFNEFLNSPICGEFCQASQKEARLNVFKEMGLF